MTIQNEASDSSNLSSTVNSMTLLKNPSSFFNFDNNLEKHENKVIQSQKNLISNLMKENTCLKIELKAFLEGNKTNNNDIIQASNDNYLIVMKDKEDVEKLLFDIRKYVLSLRQSDFFIST